MTQHANAGRILVVDDEPGDIVLVSRLMKGLGDEVATASGWKSARSRLDLWRD
jgi:CheY-like chemotaxis protein